MKLPSTRVTLHLKTDRVVRDRLLGSLRARGVTMQDFFDALMRRLVAEPAHIEQIEQWHAEPSQAPAAPAPR